MNCGQHVKAAFCVSSIIVLFAALSGVHGEETGKILKITPEQFDFGTVDEGKAAVATATVENIGGTKIEITNVRTN
jgi:hypothetical protein